MSMTTKFNGKCVKCKTFIPAGSKANWKKAYGITCYPECPETSVEGPAKPEPKVESLGDFTAVLELFATAKQKLKWPKIKLDTRHGGTIKLSVAGLNAKRPGTINVADDAPFGQGTWYGRITAEGVFEVSPSGEKSEHLYTITQLLKALAADPAGVAARHGRQSGNCCFCSLELTDQKSLDVGYGPVCAKNFGLPWGAKKKEAA